MTITHGKFIFGIPKTLPQLVNGWELFCRSSDWLKAKSPSGEMHFVGSDGKAYKQIKMPNGEIRIDTETPIEIQ